VRATRYFADSAAPQGDIRGLTYRDVVGFQTENDRDNFAHYLVGQGGTPRRGGYEIDGRRVRLGAFPVSIETKAYMCLARNAGRSAMLALVRESAEAGSCSALIGWTVRKAFRSGSSRLSGSWR
jgi:trehalose-6-phosphate synthase